MADPIEFSDSTPRFNLPFLFAGQSQKEFFVNEAHALTDMLVQTSVKDELTDAPTSPAEGEIWLVAPGSTGAWSGHDGSLAGWQSGIWKFITPVEGMRVFDEAAGQMIAYFGAWNRPAAPSSPSGGATVDSELRTAFDGLIEALRDAGIFPVAT